MASWNEEGYADNINDNGLAQVVKSNKGDLVDTSMDSTTDYYDMSHQKRGTAVILNHKYFAIPNLNTRSGTKLDRDKLKKVLKNLGFKVQVYNDLTYEGVMKVVKKEAEADHSRSDAFIMAVLTHGKQNSLYANDKSYKSATLWTNFTEDKCPSLSGKPKMFIIQACQGHTFDEGVLVKSVVDEQILPVPRMSSPQSTDFEVFAHPDFLLAFSTIPGYFSWRNKKNGSWFIQALCSELKSHGRTWHLLKLLTKVSRSVAINCESIHPERPSKKQIPCVMSGLTKLLLFPEKSSKRVHNLFSLK